MSSYCLAMGLRYSLRWRHNGRDSVSNHQPYDCLLNRLFRRRWKKTPKLRVTGLCSGNSPGTGEFPAQMASNAENVSIWWRRRHHGIDKTLHNTTKYSPILSQPNMLVLWLTKLVVHNMILHMFGGAIMCHWFKEYLVALSVQNHYKWHSGCKIDRQEQYHMFPNRVFVNNEIYSSRLYIQ